MRPETHCSSSGYYPSPHRITALWQYRRTPSLISNSSPFSSSFLCSLPSFLLRSTLRSWRGAPHTFPFPSNRTPAKSSSCILYHTQFPFFVLSTPLGLSLVISYPQTTPSSQISRAKPLACLPFAIFASLTRQYTCQQQSALASTFLQATPGEAFDGFNFCSHRNLKTHKCAIPKLLPLALTGHVARHILQTLVSCTSYVEPAI